MRVGRVVGNVVSTVKHPALHGQRLLLVDEESLDGKLSHKPRLALDVTSAAPGQRVFFVRGREAAHALDDVFNPADAAIVAQVDRLEGPVNDAPPAPRGAA